MMNFPSQRAVYYLVDSAIPVLVANWLYKTPMVLKRQQFKDSRNDKIELKGSKYQQLDLHDNKEEESLNEFENEGEIESIGYVLLPFVALSQKESNRPIDMGKGIRSLNHFK